MPGGGDRLNQVVSGEPSLGTPHWHHETLENNSSRTNTTITYTPNVPTGSKLIYAIIQGKATAVSNYARFVDMNGNLDYGTNIIQVANTNVALAGICSLVGGQFKVEYSGIWSGIYVITDFYWI